MGNRKITRNGKARSAYTKRNVIYTTAVGAIFFLALIPASVIHVGGLVSSWLGPPLLPQLFSIVSVVPIAWGLVLMGRATLTLVSNMGSPAPVCRSYRLVIRGPFARRRNPIALGRASYYLGIGFLTRNVLTALLFLGIIVLEVLYIKAVEEKKLEAQFGREYARYKKQTPFW